MSYEKLVLMVQTETMDALEEAHAKCMKLLRTYNSETFDGFPPGHLEIRKIVRADKHVIRIHIWEIGAFTRLMLERGELEQERFDFTKTFTAMGNMNVRRTKQPAEMQ